MKKVAILLGFAAALAGCSSHEDQMENAIRENLASQGEVKQVELTRQGDGSMTGFAVVRPTGGSADNRFNCTAQPDTAKGAGNYNWRCIRAIDEAALTEMENTIRRNFEGQGGTVEQVDLSRQDDNRMTGFAIVSDGSTRVRTECTATRASAESTNFNWQCRPAESGGAPADAGESAEAPAEGDDGK